MRSLEIFKEIAKLPRCSGNEQQLREMVITWAQAHTFTHRVDNAGNLIVYVPAKNCCHLQTRSPKTIILQGHLDMVCEKTPQSSHNFATDPLDLYEENDWLKAKDTTLGADNGIAIAITMAIAEDESIVHPPLELLFTVEEETGLHGALNLDANLLQGEYLINLDSEEEGVFTIGCAGGRDTVSSVPVLLKPATPGYCAYDLKVGGLSGGHSGVDIAKERANAIKVLVLALEELFCNLPQAELADLYGGSAHNAIPRDAFAVIKLPDEKFSEAQAILEKTALPELFKATDPNLHITLSKYCIGGETVIAEPQKIIDYLLAMPHGVSCYSHTLKNVAETSNNLAKVWLEKNTFKVLTSQRSSHHRKINIITRKIEGLTCLAGGNARSSSGYPEWQPDFEAELLKKCTSVYRQMYQKEPKIEVIHAGLECGIIGSKKAGMQMISLGPTIKNPHSPLEALYLPSVKNVYEFTVELLKYLA